MTAIAWAIFVATVVYTATYGETDSQATTRAIAFLFGTGMMLVCTFFELFLN